MSKAPRGLASVAAALAISATGWATSASPTAADTLPGGGGSECSILLQGIQRTSTTVTVTLKGYCGHKFSRFVHGVTLQRGSTSVKSSKGCSAVSSGATSCTKSFSIANPAGTQKFEIHDEWTDYHLDGVTAVHRGRFDLSFTA